jgi:outer membrane protein insertion porin family
MLRFFTRFSAFLVIVLFTVSSLHAQEPVSIDPALQALENAKVPRQLTIAGIIVTGTTYDTSIVTSISGLQVGDKVTIPGGDQFSKAIENLWRQRLFSNVQIFITKLEDDNIWLEINVQERPRLANFKFIGIKKSEQDDLTGKIGLVKSTIITENTRRTAVEIITKYYSEKGFKNVSVQIQENPETTLVNSISLTFTINKGNKVRVNEINFFGNETVPDVKLKKQMKGTKEMTKMTLHPTPMQSPYGINEQTSFEDYLKDAGFLSFSKTKSYLDPYFRFKLFSSAKFDEKKYDEDKQKLLNYYNSLGYRDATIVADTQYYAPNGNLNVDIKVEEGRRYYFGDIAWKGNTKYSDSVLSAILAIQKGDVYNVETLNRRIGKELTAEGGDISGLYMDDGYLFFRIEPVETAVYNDTIDFEIRITEGPQATIGNVNIFGNEKTKDYVIRRELRTVPGEKFSRSDIIRSQRELANLQYFNQETIDPGVVPHPETGTVDINWKLEEKSSDQLELSAGWGGGVGLTGTLGVTFNNFSIRNITKRSSWDPLPTGDGQKLSLRVQSNGKAYQSYSFAFTEPWLGGKKRNSFTVSLNKSVYRNGFYNQLTGKYEFDDSTLLKTFGAGISLGKQLKWPDDYFSLVYSLNFTQYKLKNYAIFKGLSNGTSTNVSLKIALQRSSVYDPIFPRSGSNFVASVQATPPYSLLNPDLVNSSNPYKTPEYHKWRFNAEWYVPVGKPMGAEKNRQFVLKLAAKYGFMGRYNNQLDFSPFERFQLGDAGLTNNYGLLGYDIIAQRGYPVYETSDPSINPDQQSAQDLFTIFNKYQLELRFPIVTNPGSTIYALTFFEAANGWHDFKEYNPFRLRRSAGVGMRFFLPMFGLLGFDYGIGFDRIHPGNNGLKNASRFTFMLGYEPE